MKRGGVKIRLFIVQCSVFMVSILGASYAQDLSRVDTLKQEILQAKAKEDSYAAFEEIADLYFNANKYNEFTVFLDSLAKEKKELMPVTDYFTALCRYYQLKHLEETQNWDEYFASGNNYRDQIVNSAQKTIDATSSGDSVNLYAKLVLWKFHKDQQDSLAQDSLDSLSASALEYAKNNPDLIPLKAVADELSVYGERGKSKELYKIYLDKFLSSQVKDEELVNSAAAFYKEGNLDLAEMVYDAYIVRIIKSDQEDKLAVELIDIAKRFTYTSTRASDPLYAEAVFRKAEENCPKFIFDQELLYLRARNLEKAKEYSEAKDMYLSLAERFPSGVYTDKANFKSGVIYTYILREIKNGRAYFEKLAAGDSVNAQVASALYQLGLLSQWEGDALKAKDYYSRLINVAGAGFGKITALAKERMKEIEAANPIDYNLKTFLDTSLKEENKQFDMTKLDLGYAPDPARKGEDLNINCTPYTAESGCMPVQIQYLWSGDLGSAEPSSSQSSFTTQYSDEGTYVISLVAMTDGGILDRNIAIIDVE